jgi:two-component sensor histidine kinase
MSSATELAVPIRVGTDFAGVLAITPPEGEDLDEHDLFIVQTLADQLAVAIQNSRLYERARELAASQERQRLARDLHDAVSQTLFSVSLIAEVLPRIHAKDPAKASQRLEELRLLTRGALAEMRTLLLELRPAALAEANLPDLLRQLSEAVAGRSRIPVTVDAGPCLDLPTDVRIAFYRIAQEALNNIAKHSSAAAASVRLECADVVTLTVEDDGVGFDSAAGSAGHWVGNHAGARGQCRGAAARGFGSWSRHARASGMGPNSSLNLLVLQKLLLRADRLVKRRTSHGVRSAWLSGSRPRSPAAVATGSSVGHREQTTSRHPGREVVFIVRGRGRAPRRNGR